MARQKRFANARCADASPNGSNSISSNGSPHQVASPRSYNSQYDGSTMVSEFTSQFSDGDNTPIPSLHGNLVRNRYRQDPMTYYDRLDILGEGSMGSVSRVRKRTEVIGGSARKDFVSSNHKRNKGFFSFLQFCPTQMSASDSSLTTSSQGAKSDDRNTQSCFSLFCCPAQETKTSSTLDPIREDASVGGTLEEERRCWGGFFGAILPQRNIENAVQNVPTTKIEPNSSSEDDNILSEEDKHTIERQMERALKHSPSSLITYGHKEVIYALKSIHLDRVSSSDFMKELKNEVSILKELDHPHIVKCYETFNYNSSLYLVLEICSGSDLYSRDPYSEQEACSIIRSILSAVAYMHSKRITHRDLKYENIMFASPEKDAEVKIIDFGLSKKYAADTFLHDTVGTVYTMAPELLKGGYTEVVDVWSLGVIAFMLLSSSMPFYGKDRKQVIKKIVKGQYQFISRRWKTVSSDAKQFVVRLLMQDPHRRPSATKALADPWLNRCNFDSQGFAPEVAMMDKVQATIQTFAGYGKLKKLALMLIAYRSTSEEIGFLRKMFDKFDMKHDGELTLEEFKTVLADYEYSDVELEMMFRAMDLDGTGLVHYSEFLAATIEAHASLSEEQVAECFDRLDNDDSGYITKEDIADFLPGIPQSYVDDIMQEADLNNDNRISYSEFLALWDQKGDAKMKKDQEDVKKRRLRRADSAVSELSEFSDDDFDELAIQPTFIFEEDEIAKMLQAPDTPVSGKRISAVNAFVLEKERSVRDSSTRARSLGGSGALSSPVPRHANEIAASPPGVFA